MRRPSSVLRREERGKGNSQGFRYVLRAHGLTRKPVPDAMDRLEERRRRTELAAQGLHVLVERARLDPVGIVPDGGQQLLALEGALLVAHQLGEQVELEARQLRGLARDQRL